MGLFTYDKKNKNNKGKSEESELKPEMTMNGPDLEIKRKLGRSDFQVIPSKSGVPLIRLNPTIQDQMGFTNDGLTQVLNDFLDRVFRVTN